MSSRRRLQSPLRTLRRWSLGAAILLAAPGAAAAVDWLVLVVDRSSSIDSAELALQRQAYVDVLRDEEIAPLLRDARVAIVEFDTIATVVVDWSSADEASRRYADWTPEGPRGGTGIGRALRAALELLADKPGRRVIDISGDGRDNRDPALLEEMRAAATASGIEINGLAFAGHTRESMTKYYAEHVANGFVLPVHDKETFFEALRRKLKREIALTSLPPPTGGAREFGQSREPR